MYEVTLINDGNETVIHSPYFNDLKLSAGLIKQGINVADGFTFTILPNNPGYELIRPLKTLIQVFNAKTQRIEFDGRILMPTESMEESGAFSKSFICESELGYLNDSAQRHGEYHNITVREFLKVIIDNHNRDVAKDGINKTFELGIVEVNSSSSELYRYLGYDSTLDTIDDKLISRLGGELRVRKENGIRYLDYLKMLGEKKETEIRLSKNLKSITREADSSEIITRLIPLGERIESEDEDATDASEERLTIESVNNGKDYIDDPVAMSAFGIIAKSNAWDDITQPSILKTRGLQLLEENNRVKAKYQITALDLSLIDLDIYSFDVGNYYPVINPIMEINENLRVVGKAINILDPKNSTLEIGDKFMMASEYQYEANKTKKHVTELENTVTKQSRQVRELSKASKEAQEEILILHDMIENINAEEIEETLALITQQLIDISEIINDIGHEIFDLELRINLLEDFKEQQYLINDDYISFKQEVLERLEDLEDGN